MDTDKHRLKAFEILDCFHIPLDGQRPKPSVFIGVYLWFHCFWTVSKDKNSPLPGKAFCPGKEAMAPYFRHPEGMPVARSPPSTGSEAPVMLAAAGEQRNAAACPMSSGVP